MILKIRNSRFGKGMSLSMIALMLFTIVQPTASYALTGGAAQPEFNAFTPIGTSDMVDLSSGDFTYNIPIMDIGGFPINLAYKSGVTMDQEASWVGLGWDLGVGQINRQMRGLPDDFKRDEMFYENNIKDNWTVGASFKVDPALFGAELVPEGTAPTEGSPFTVGLSGQYNSYNGMSMSPSAGVSSDQKNIASVGLSVSSGPDGLSINPTASLSARYAKDSKNDHMQALTGSLGLSFNSRQGLTSVNMSATSSAMTMKKLKTKGAGSIGSAISYVPNTYTPTVQSNILNLSGTFNAAVGTEAYGIEGNAQIRAFTSTQVLTNKEETQYAYGYENTHLAGKQDVLDFNREKDGNFSVNSTNLPITNYTHDIYSVQGQGVSGMFRPYRSQVGYVYDNNVYNSSVGGALGGEFGAGGTAHVGTDFEMTTTIGESGVWDFNNNAINSFKSSPSSNELYEEVYFKNVGDLSVDDEISIYGDSASRWGQYSPLHLQITGAKYKRELNSSYDIKHASEANLYYPSPLSPAYIKRNQRVRRNQNVQQITAKEAEDHNLLGFTRHTEAKDHHTAGFVITRNDGARYVYGKALYNTTKKEATFALGEGIGGASAPHVHTGDCTTGLIGYTPDKDNSLKNKHGDHYFNRVTTPPYAHTFLLSTLLSTDYADTDEIEGPSDEDLGSYTKFTYYEHGDDIDAEMAGMQPLKGEYKWRVPFNENEANFNEGLKTDPTDDKGSYVYGEKELAYIKKIETKTHVAIFHISEREDAKGVKGENGGEGENSSMYQLDKISLYSKGEYGTPGATPIKEAHFIYNYSLCPQIDNSSTGEGKLTLEKVYFTYRNSNMGKYSPYEFHYENDNPDYNLKAYDIWGNYKHNPDGACNLTEDLFVPEFNYVEQDQGQIDQNTAAWTMSKITLPSGGEIIIDYEADDYQYVQDKKAMRMFKLVGAGDSEDPFSAANNFEAPSLDDGNILNNKEALLYKGTKDADYLYIKLDEEDYGIDNNEFREKYLRGIVEEQKGLLQFRMLMNMTPGGGITANDSWKNKPFDYVTGYAELDVLENSYVFDDGLDYYGSVHVKTVEMEGGFASSAIVSPFPKAGWNFARKYLSNYVYGLPGLDEASGAAAAVEAVVNAVENLVEVFTGPNALLKGKKVARRFIPHKSWIRLNNPRDKKLGGGCRVKRVEMTDGWHNMIGEPEESPSNQKYGQEYTYTLEDGSSSGVATYEPIGSKENPFVQPSFVEVNRVLAPNEENYIEKPFGESFFPNPTVTYSRVSVKNLERINSAEGKHVLSNATGKVVTEFFTSKDYPTITDQTNLEVKEDHNPLLSGFLNINVRKHLTLTQGYVVHLNDMNGKMKSQRVYAEGQEAAISGVDYVYDATTPENPESLGTDEDFVLLASNKGKIDNRVRTLHPDGSLNWSTLGVEYDIINDFREKRSETETVGVNANLATFLIGLIPGVVPVPLPDLARHEDKLNMSVTTKVINTFGILREVVAHDAGASVSTRNLLWDSQTGEVLLTETLNEYGDKYYSFNYPAHWAYEGMSMAATNSGMLAKVEAIDATAGTYRKTDGEDASPCFHEGDEVLVGSSGAVKYAWVTELSGTSITLQDNEGDPVNISDDEFTLKVVRSGRRNLQSTSMGSTVLMQNPIETIEAAGNIIEGDFLMTADPDEYYIINAGAVEFSDNWKPPCECGVDTKNDTYNKYLYNEKGVWRADKSWLYLTGRNQASGEAITRDDGFYNNFSPFYRLNASGWEKNETDWTYTSEVTQYSPYGFELENQDALGRKSAAQYGYNHSFPLAVGANSAYKEMGFDGFEDYRNFTGCRLNEHFGFREDVDPAVDITPEKSHTGRYSLKVNGGQRITRVYHVDCNRNR